MVEAEESCSVGRRLWKAPLQMYVDATSGEALVLCCPPQTSSSQSVGCNPLEDQLTLLHGSPKTIRRLRYLYNSSKNKVINIKGNNFTVGGHQNMGSYIIGSH